MWYNMYSTVGIICTMVYCVIVSMNGDPRIHVNRVTRNGRSLLIGTGFSFVCHFYLAKFLLNFL